MIRAWLGGVALALSWLTMLPARGPSEIDRAVAGRAISAAPVAGAVLAAAATAVCLIGSTVGTPPLVTGLVCVGVLAVGTRGMHVDGLSDTADGLGCYGPPERAREVMHSGGAGPFGVAALVVVLGLQAASFGALADADAWWAVAFAVFSGRVAVVVACRRGVAAAPGSGFGALVAGTQGVVPIAVWTVAAVALSLVCLPGPVWAGPVVVTVVLVVAVLFARHCAARFGGTNGDVLGAVTEGTVAAVAVAAASLL
ncbi:adenosylcobinamide-GDP ribazoletransferase [Rhodococcus rhodochrous]|uniref:adenosylcobinamide-GDP ribazoletransferase n=1 Tax=Rhodococcus rhodochrous TaxID=1829 RepID=UPI001E397C27|nr:adenosylcobinamide-GDP ribazoletransferase [Rhodococcus rhodochrous]MCD2096149.1 adenosylcobinamide-GDP ribazoletransferase [Rhodococcus rhodochrous]MCD2120907.1 adenosylcobinamide-GDP ribazoletransferase [Rhodococcus rhodochrous]MCQ4134525.1 adenosylcobinamide-GDP ribazoletransferase [Rhodococcus rhodochrous]MDJ0017773.1 adenosylcobinamide-GDP ribazoletransferase [Rhodococcus rhodochrous]